MKTDSTIGLKQLREDPQGYADRVKNGESFTVRRKNEVLFRIVSADTEDWETVIDFRDIDPRGIGVPADDVLDAITNLKSKQ